MSRFLALKSLAFVLLQQGFSHYEGDSLWWGQTIWFSCRFFVTCYNCWVHGRRKRATLVIGLQQLKGLFGITHFTTRTDVVSVLKFIFSSVHQEKKETSKKIGVLRNQNSSSTTDIYFITMKKSLRRHQGHLIFYLSQTIIHILRFMFLSVIMMLESLSKLLVVPLGSCSSYIYKICKKIYVISHHARLNDTLEILKQLPPFPMKMNEELTKLLPNMNHWRQL